MKEKHTREQAASSYFFLFVASCFALATLIYGSHIIRQSVRTERKQINEQVQAAIDEWVNQYQSEFADFTFNITAEGSQESLANSSPSVDESQYEHLWDYFDRFPIETQHITWYAEVENPRSDL